MAIYNTEPVRIRSYLGRTVTSVMARIDPKEQMPRRGNRHKRDKNLPSIADQLKRTPSGWTLKRGE